VAKVYRDALMATLHCRYPAFGWRENAGYGTPAHLAALRGAGACPEHRTVFIATALNGGQRARKDGKDSEHAAEPQRLLE
jgi:ribonuclease HII